MAERETERVVGVLDAGMHHAGCGDKPHAAPQRTLSEGGVGVVEGARAVFRVGDAAHMRPENDQ